MVCQKAWLLLFFDAKAAMLSDKEHLSFSYYAFLRSTTKCAASLLSLATVCVASPESNVELVHGSGSESVVDTTYF